MTTIKLFIAFVNIKDGRQKSVQYLLEWRIKNNQVIISCLVGLDRKKYALKRLPVSMSESSEKKAIIVLCRVSQ